MSNPPANRMTSHELILWSRQGREIKARLLRVDLAIGECDPLLGFFSADRPYVSIGSWTVRHFLAVGPPRDKKGQITLDDKVEEVTLGRQAEEKISDWLRAVAADLFPYEIPGPRRRLSALSARWSG